MINMRVTFWNKLGIEVLENIMKISSRPREIMAGDWRWYWQTELNHNTRDPDLRRAMHILHTAMQHKSVVLKTIFPLPPSANICSYCGHLSHLWIPANNCESLAHHLQHFRLSKHIIMTCLSSTNFRNKPVQRWLHVCLTAVIYRQAAADQWNQLITPVTSVTK